MNGRREAFQYPGSGVETDVVTGKKPGTDPVFALRRQGKLLSRGEAADLMGLSMSEFKRRESLGQYIATHIAPNGWHLFSIEYLSTLPGCGEQTRSAKKRKTALEKATQQLVLEKPALEKTVPQEQLLPLTEPTPKPVPSVPIRHNLYYEPQVAAKIFDAFDNNLDASEIVKKFLIHPDVVTTIYAAWLRMKTMRGGGIQISASTLEIINNELGCLPGTYPVTNEAQLLANLREAARDVPVCNSCKSQACRLCHSCAKALYFTEEAAPPRPAAKQTRPRKSA